MRQYKGIVRNAFAGDLTYREHFIVMFLTSFVYYIVLYFLWKAIYAGSGGTVNGQTFASAYVNLALTSCLVRCLTSEIEWGIHYSILDGNIIIELVRPVNYMMYKLAEKIGYVITNIITLAVPVFVVIIVFFPGHIYFGFNVIMFMVCMILSFLMMFSLEFITGVIAFYTQSVWGISTVKNVIISFFAGSNVPLSFFPAGLFALAQILPFKSMYHDPLRILMDPTMGLAEYIQIIGFQFFWLAVLMGISGLLFRIMSKRLDVNGG